MNKNRKRAIKFWILEYLVAPIALLLMRVWVATWRLEIRDREPFLALIRQEPRLGVAIWHGCILALLKGAPVAYRAGRALNILSSPSRDGRLGQLLSHTFGVGTIVGSSAARAVLAGRELTVAMEEGKLVLLTVDGPRGPRAEAKPGLVRIAHSAGARVLAVNATARRMIRFRSWDRMFLPLPFTTVYLDWRVVELSGDQDQDRITVENAIREAGAALPFPCPPQEGLS